MREDAKIYEANLLGVGFYTAADASKLLRTPVRNINRWLGGYRYVAARDAKTLPPLWKPQLPRGEFQLELGFRDLIELRFVVAFARAGVKLQTIRRCLEMARTVVDDERPLSTRRFLTDGKTIFLDEISGTKNDESLLDLKRKQYAIKQVIEQTLTDLDFEKNAVSQWRPFKGRKTIVVDPSRSFGQPIVAEHGVPTAALAAAFEGEESIRRVSALFRIPVRAVREALEFEKYLQAA